MRELDQWKLTWPVACSSRDPPRLSAAVKTRVRSQPQDLQDPRQPVIVECRPGMGRGRDHEGRGTT
jgi:hypothetical protein